MYTRLAPQGRMNDNRFQPDDREFAREPPSHQAIIGPRQSNLPPARASSLYMPSSHARMISRYPKTGACCGGSGGGAASALTSCCPLPADDADGREMRCLNDRFAQYVEKTRVWEALNKKLHRELESLTTPSGEVSSAMRAMYETEIAGAKKVLDDMQHQIGAVDQQRGVLLQEFKRVEVEREKVSRYTSDDRARIEQLNHSIAKNEAEIALFRRRIADIEDQIQRHKAEVFRMQSDMSQLRNEIQAEQLMARSCEQERAHCEREMMVFKQTLTSRSGTCCTSREAPKDFYDGLVEAIKECRTEYEADIDYERNRWRAEYNQYYSEYVSIRPVVHEESSDQTAHLREELVKLTMENSQMEMQNSSISSNIKIIETKIHEMRTEISRIEENARRDALKLKERRERAIASREQTSNLRVKLQQEIEQYKRLLDDPRGIKEYFNRSLTTIAAETGKHCVYADQDIPIVPIPVRPPPPVYEQKIITRQRVRIPSPPPEPPIERIVTRSHDYITRTYESDTESTSGNYPGQFR